MRIGILAALAAAVLGGCVSTDTFEKSEGALGACRTELKSCRDGAQAAAEQASAGLASCRQEVDRCKDRGAAQLDVCMQVRRGLETDLGRLNQEVASCHKDVDALRGRSRAELLACVDARHKAESELSGTGHALKSCRQEVALTRSNALAIEERATQLRDRMQSEIADKSVEIEQLKDKLSVHVLDRILFKSGSVDVLPEGRAVLAKLAAVFAESEDLIRVEGHTDKLPIGRALRDRFPSNWELSAARASSVVRFFEETQKISPLRLEAVGFSSYRPVTEGETPEELQRNRRVEIVLSAALKRDN